MKNILMFVFLLESMLCYPQNKKISELSAVTSTVVNIDLVGIQGGVTKKISDSLLRQLPSYHIRPINNTTPLTILNYSTSTVPTISILDTTYNSGVLYSICDLRFTHHNSIGIGAGIAPSLSTLLGANSNVLIGTGIWAAMTHPYTSEYGNCGDNVLIGDGVMDMSDYIGSDNVGIGAKVFEHADSSGYLIGIGTSVMGQGHVRGGYNIGIGHQSLRSLEKASYDIAIGDGAGFSLTTGGHNLLLGNNAGDELTASSYRLYIGTGDSVDAPIYGDMSKKRYRINGDLLIKTNTITPSIIISSSDTTGFGKTENIGMVRYHTLAKHFYGLVGDTPPTWKQLDQ
jgi:hypothetical protein